MISYTLIFKFLLRQEDKRQNHEIKFIWFKGWLCPHSPGAIKEGNEQTVSSSGRVIHADRFL
jgi:hypothetical protein